MSEKLHCISRVLKLHFSQSNPPGKTEHALLLLLCACSEAYLEPSRI